MTEEVAIDMEGLPLHPLYGAVPMAADLEARSVQGVMQALVQSERDYIEGVLYVIVEQILKTIESASSMGMEMMSQNDADIIFSTHIRSLYEMHSQLLNGLQDINEQSVTEAFLGLFPYFKIYAEYINNYSRAIKRFEKLLAESVPFMTFLSSRDVDLQRLLTIPLYRLPQYLIYLSLLESKAIALDGSLSAELHSGVEQLSDIIAKLSAGFKKQRDKDALFELAEKLKFHSIVTNSGKRRIFHSGEVVLLDASHSKPKSQHYFVAVLTDQVLLQRRHKVQGAASTSLMNRLRHFMTREEVVSYSIADADLQPSADNPLQCSLVLGGDIPRTFTMECRQSSEVQRWVRDFRLAQAPAVDEDTPHRERLSSFHRLRQRSSCRALQLSPIECMMQHSRTKKGRRSEEKQCPEEEAYDRCRIVAVEFERFIDGLLLPNKRT